jgi:poly(hydroxyalkanoate) depolymerase family esterase
VRAERLLCLAVAAVVVGAAGSAPGQGRARRDAEFTRGTLGDRPYRLFVPREVGARPPLIIALHGCWQTPEDFALGTRLNAAAQRRGLLVLYPAQRPRDNPSRCWNWFEPAHQSRTSGELAEILALVREVRSRYPGDRERTIALGFSAGAFMAVNLACVAPDVVAGVGVFAGGPYRCGVGAEAFLDAGFTRPSPAGTSPCGHHWGLTSVTCGTTSAMGTSHSGEHVFVGEVTGFIHAYDGRAGEDPSVRFWVR